MKAAVIAEGHRFDVKEVPVPEIGSQEVLVQVKAVGICGSDVGGFFAEVPKSRVPGLIMGHEGSGVVAKVGSEVTHVAVGDRVAIDPQIYCGTCYACRHGWTSICESKKVTGSSLRGFVNGLFAEYAVINGYQAFKIPETLSFISAAMIEPVSNAVHVANRISPSLGDFVVVIGAGALGLSIIQTLKLKGVGKIVVLDISSFRLERAKELGAHAVINTAQEDAVALIKEMTGGVGSDYVVESAGLGATYRMAISLVRKRGTIVAFGALVDQIEIDLLPILHKEITIVGSTGANAPEVEYAIELLDRKAIVVDPIVTHTFGLDDAEKAMYLFKDPKASPIKVMIEP